ncbi:hypothetical protein [Edaphovirga cremea]|uniref:hypothetical protein n=1 Tax=Edaphovirga cremea TaxID=2267246 RepID=UPI00398A18CD
MKYDVINIANVEFFAEIHSILGIKSFFSKAPMLYVIEFKAKTNQRESLPCLLAHYDDGFHTLEYVLISLSLNHFGWKIQ